MNSSTLPPFGICADCGAWLAREERKCWLCGKAVEAATTTAEKSGSPYQPSAASDATLSPPELRAANQFSLASLMLAIAFVSVLLGVFVAVHPTSDTIGRDCWQPGFGEGPTVARNVSMSTYVSS